MKHVVTGLILTMISTVSWAETWDCRQLRDVLVGPPFYVNQEETELDFQISIASGEIKLPESEQVFQCAADDCREALSANDFLLKGRNDDATFILSSAGTNLGFSAGYSITSNPSVGETTIRMGACTPND